MWWFVWLLSYLGIGCCVMGFCMAMSAKNRRFDPVEPDIVHIIGAILGVVMWPLVVCLVLVMAIAVAAKPKTRQEREEA